MIDSMAHDRLRSRRLFCHDERLQLQSPLHGVRDDPSEPEECDSTLRLPVVLARSGQSRLPGVRSVLPAFHVSVPILEPDARVLQCGGGPVRHGKT